MKGVQRYELFGGIALKDHALKNFFSGFNAEFLKLLSLLMLKQKE